VDVAQFVPTYDLTSSAIRDFRRIPDPGLDPRGFVAEIHDFIRHGGHDMLIPADDQALMALTRHYGEFERHLFIACPGPQISALVLDKFSTLRLAQKHGIHVPRTQLVSNSTELHRLSSIVPFPWVLKPARKQTSVEQAKSFTATTADQVAAKFPEAQEFSPPMLLQEYCPGVGVGVEVLMHKGECRALFQHRRLEEAPYTGGFSATALAEQPDSRLVDQSLALLRAMEWEGPAMVEFKVNPKDGSAVLMEVNGRYWGTISLPVVAGLDFPLYHWQLVHGEMPSPPETYAVGMRWRWTAGHIWRFHELLRAARHSSSAREELRRTISGFPALFDPSICDAMWTPPDPMPAIFELIHILTFLFLDDVKTVLRRIRTRLMPGQHQGTA